MCSPVNGWAWQARTMELPHRWSISGRRKRPMADEPCPGSGEKSANTGPGGMSQQPDK